MTGKGEEFECAVCHGVFIKARSDEEARAEKRRIWQSVPNSTEEEFVCCEDCFQKIIELAQREHPEFLRGYGL